MPHTISFKAQRYSILCYNALIDDLDRDVHINTDLTFTPYKGRFASLSCDLRDLSEQIHESVKKDFTELAARFDRLKGVFEDKCVIAFRSRLSKFSQKISTTATSSLVADYIRINEEMKIYRSEKFILQFGLPKLKTDSVSKEYTGLLRLINAKIHPLQLKVHEKRQQISRSYAPPSTFSDKAQLLSAALFEQQIEDLQNDIEGDPDCRYSTYNPRLRSLIRPMCRGMLSASNEYQEQITNLKARAQEVKQMFLGRCVTVNKMTVIESRLDMIHSVVNPLEELTLLAEELRLLAPCISVSMQKRFEQLQTRWQDASLEVLRQGGSPFSLPRQPRHQSKWGVIGLSVKKWSQPYSLFFGRRCGEEAHRKLETGERAFKMMAHGF